MILRSHARLAAGPDGASSPPGPPPHHLLGHLPEFRRDPLGFFTRCAREYGDIVRYRIGPRTAYLVSHPDLVEQILIGNARNFVRGRVIQATRQVMGDGLVTSDWDAWRQQRRWAQPAFHRDMIEGYVGDMVAVTDRHLDGWRAGETMNLCHALNDLAREIATQTFIKSDIDAQATQIDQVITAVWEGLNARFANGLLIPAAIPTPNHLRLALNIRRLDELMYRTIDQRRETASRDDLLSLLFDAHDEGGRPLTRRQIRDQALTLFLAGHETTYLAIVWALYLLGQHPEVEQRARREVQDVLAGRAPGPSNLARLTFLEKVVWESMRLYPTVWVMPRLALDDFDLGGYRLRAGSSVTVCQWVIHRDTRFFDDPETFRPERWEQGLADQLPPFAFMPFGGGPRKCIGHSFGMTEVLLVTAMILSRFRVHLVPGQEVVPKPLFALRPERDVLVKLERC